MTRALFLSATAFLSALFSFSACAQISIIQTTNYYVVTGANFREVRQSINTARPWSDGFDAETRWNIEWKFNFAPSAAGCACTSFGITSRLVTTMPRWTPPASVAPEMKERWTSYFTNLARHEFGHARIGIAAANEVHKAIAGISAQPDCDQLKKLIDESANRVVESYRARDREYDRRTNHGMMPMEAR